MFDDVKKIAQFKRKMMSERVKMEQNNRENLFIHPEKTSVRMFKLEQKRKESLKQVLLENEKKLLRERIARREDKLRKEYGNVVIGEARKKNPVVQKVPELTETEPVFFKTKMKIPINTIQSKNKGNRLKSQFRVN